LPYKFFIDECTMNATILIVDDKPIVRENLSEVLGKEYQVRLAGSADEADAQLASGEVELALLDCTCSVRGKTTPASEFSRKSAATHTADWRDHVHGAG
jgi:DNA-binding NtrC family response regulator